MVVVWIKYSVDIAMELLRERLLALLLQHKVTFSLAGMYLHRGVCNTFVNDALQKPLATSG